MNTNDNIQDPKLHSTSSEDDLRATENDTTQSLQETDEPQEVCRYNV